MCIRDRLFQHLLRTVHSHRSSKDEDQDKTFRILLFGTHRDQEEKCKKEPLTEKNRKLSKILFPEFKEYVQYYNVGTRELIFPMNAKSPGEEEKAITETVRSIVTNECRPDPKDLPLQWLGLEILLEEITRVLDRELLSKSECLEIAKKLHFDESTLEAALVYLDELSLIFYFPEILPELVFTNPQVLLDKVTELVKEHFDLMLGRGPHRSCTVGDMWQEFIEYALVSINFLSQKPFEKHYVPGLFEPEHLVVLFRKLLIFATYADQKNFVPCLLRMLDDSEVSKHRETFQSAAAPLALKFPHGGPRQGLFCSLMSFLTSPELKPSPWELKRESDFITPTCLKRNCIQFTITQTSCTVMLIDAFTHFEVHVLATLNVCCDECPNILRAILTGCQKAALNLDYTDSKPVPAFLCPCGNGEAHIANSIDHNWICSLNNGVGGEITDSQRIWFEDDSSAGKSG